MTSKDFDPLRLDVAAYAKAGGETAGEWPLIDLHRLRDSAVADALAESPRTVHWSARGESRPVRGSGPQPWLHLAASTSVPLECQRCLKPVEVPLNVDRSFLFVHGEDAAAQLDTDSEDDVLALTRALDLRELLEDELLLALPIVPRHEVCPDPLLVPEDVEVLEDDKPNPFAALAKLRQSGPAN